MVSFRGTVAPETRRERPSTPNGPIGVPKETLPCVLETSGSPLEHYPEKYLPRTIRVSPIGNSEQHIVLVTLCCYHQRQQGTGVQYLSFNEVSFFLGDTDQVEDTTILLFSRNLQDAVEETWEPQWPSGAFWRAGESKSRLSLALLQCDAAGARFVPRRRVSELGRSWDQQILRRAGGLGRSGLRLAES